ncbi:sugar phosphate isomerase/epimerase family protein [Rhizorhabdus sp.]|uniref:sugar phosphate isomerase/epimerase family protein n=1 Tax=Rhizorhabdus sp. TaxID=1968843 RepID=UPI0035AF0EC2
MKLALSNLAFPADMPDAVLSDLVEAGLGGLEVALTRIAPWVELTPARILEFRQRIADLGLQAPSLQAIFFGVEGGSLFGTEEQFARLAARLEHVTDFGALLGSSVAVFGAPGTRQTGDLPEAEAWAIGRDRLARLADIAGASDIRLGIEPVPSFYGGDFLRRWQDIAAMVREIGHSHLALHLDIGCVSLGEDDIVTAIEQTQDILCHYHVSERNLGAFAAPEFPHRAAAHALSATDYDHWISIEMALQADRPLDAIREAVAFAAAAYRPALD